MKIERLSGASLGLTVALTLTLVLIGSCLFYLVRMIGGAKQVSNATDSGALAAARSIMTVGLADNDPNVGPVFQGLGVDPHSGIPDPTDQLSNNKGIFAYNRAAGAATLVALNAAKENTASAIANANIVIGQLQTFGTALSTAIVNSGETGNPSAVAFTALASQNNVNMMGPNSSTSLPVDANLAFKSVITGTKSNIYFNSATFAADAADAADKTFLTTVASSEDKTGSILSTSQPDANAPSYETGTLYQTGRPLLKAYEPIVLDNKALSPIYFCAVNPTSTPHLIDNGRFNNSAAQIGYAPPNAVSGQTQTKDAYSKNAVLSAAASAVIGGLYNEYPAQIPRGYIEVCNGPNAPTANPQLPALIGNVDGTNNIFNKELWFGLGGDNGIQLGEAGSGEPVFCTVLSGSASIMSKFVIYNDSKGTKAGDDDFKRNHLLDPAYGKYQSAATQALFADDYQTQLAKLANGTPYVAGSTDQNGNTTGNTDLRIQAKFNNYAQWSDMLTIKNVTDACTVSSLAEDNPTCEKYLATFKANYDSTASVTSYNGPSITGLEYVKGLFSTEWYDAVATQKFGNFSFSVPAIPNDSGSKFYSRTLPCAAPTNTPEYHAAVEHELATANPPIPYVSVPLTNPPSAVSESCAFGTVTTPYGLLYQLSQNGANCVNPAPNSAFWNNDGYVQAQLLQRANEICPGTTAAQLVALLNTTPLGISGIQYIYLPPGASALAISTSPPSTLQGLAEYTAPGSTQPDGPISKSCEDAVFDPVGNIVDAAIGYASGGYVNAKGDNDLHDQPFTVLTGAPPTTYDYVTWQPSSGGAPSVNLPGNPASLGGFNFLGRLTFYNHTSGSQLSGSSPPGRFSTPN